jgi:hypothetical protein
MAPPRRSTCLYTNVAPVETDPISLIPRPVREWRVTNVSQFIIVIVVGNIDFSGLRPADVYRLKENTVS